MARNGQGNAIIHNYRILVLACKPDHLNALVTACEQAHQEVIPCTTIDEAFNFLERKDHVDVIVVEAFMEHESVFEFLTAAKQAQELQDVPIVIVASEPGDMGKFCLPNIVQVSDCLGSYKFIYLPKFNAEMLVREISAVLPQERLPKKESDPEQS